MRVCCAAPCRTVSDRRPAEEARLPVDQESVEDSLAYLCLGKFKSDAEGDPGYWDTRWVLLTDLLEAEELDADDLEEALNVFESTVQEARDSLLAATTRA